MMKDHNIAATVILVAAVVLSANIASAADVGRPAEPKPAMSISAQSVASGGTVDVIADFKLGKKVHLYKDKLRFEWTKLVGAKFTKAVLPKPETVPDPLADKAGETIEVYTGQVKILGRLTVTAKPGEPVSVEGKMLHQSCTDQICFPPASEPFAFKLVATEAEAPGDDDAEAIDETLEWLAAQQSGKTEGWPAEPAKTAATTEAASVAPKDVQESDAAAEAADETEDDDRALWVILGGAFLAGIALALTPCVYPMIPITAAVIGARKEKGILSALAASFVYVLGLAIVYALLGLLVATVGSSVAAFLQSAYVLIPVSGVFVALAIVMFAGLNFGAPTGFAAKLQGLLAGKKGFASTFILGAVSGLIAGPCIAAPLAGVLLYIARSGNLTLGFWMLFVLAWGMGAPLILFGTATGLMPKAGAWMEWIKRLLGFVLLWAAAYFLQAIIGEAAYLISFGALLLAAAVFLGGFDTLTKESGFGDRLKRLLGIATVIAALVLLIPPLAEMSGLSLSGSANAPVENVFTPATQENVEAAIAAGKPVVLDFTATSCLYCKALDKRVFTKPETIAAAKGVTMLKIDVHKYPGLADRYGVFGPPTLVFIGTDGKVRKDLGFAGLKTLGEFVELLRKFKE